LPSHFEHHITRYLFFIQYDKSIMETAGPALNNQANTSKIHSSFCPAPGGLNNMKFTRRKFIESSAFAALAATLGHVAGGSALGRGTGIFFGASKPGPLTYLKREHFLPFINTGFRVRNEAGRTAELQLKQAVDTTMSTNYQRGFRGDSYLLSFDTTRKMGLTQGVYEFDHEYLGRFSLFLAPVSGTGFHYEAIINRIC
jgi:hypothetical protein